MAANSGLVDEYLEPGFATRVGTRRRLERLSAEVKRSEASHEGEKFPGRLFGAAKMRDPGEKCAGAPAKVNR